MSLAKTVTILEHQEVIPGHYFLGFFDEEMAREAQPGQFVHVRCGESLDPLLRRPLSLHCIDQEQGRLGLLYRVVGRGTEWLSQQPVGAILDIMGPLGQGFYLSPSPSTGSTEAVVIGGGIGVAPLLALVQNLVQQKIQVTVILGARDAENLLGVDAFAQTGAKLSLVTDDGSQGEKGTVVSVFQQFAEGQANPQKLTVYACGPHPMLYRLWQYCGQQKIPLQLSLEERMGCGVGACLGCVCKVRKKTEPTDLKPDSTQPQWQYARVCLEGPVFWGAEVYFDAEE